MRYKEFNLSEDELFEINMSPSNLAKLAKNIDARVGMEFELIVPGVEDEEEEQDIEPDYDYDEAFPTGANWRRYVLEFFTGGDAGDSRSYIQRQIDSLDEEFQSWADDEFASYEESDRSSEDAFEIAQSNVDRNDYESRDEYDAAVEDYLEQNEDYIRDELQQRFFDNSDLFERFIDEQDISTMVEFASQYNLSWPYVTYPESGGGISVDAVADDFSQMIGKPVNASSSYHGARREPGKYVVEPDGSLEGDEGEAGLEFVSPPLTIPEMLSDLDKVVKWAGRIGAYTNDSTGLHMNVSVPGLSRNTLDYVKLAIFLGDEYVLEQFGRAGNSYCKSAMKAIREKAKSNPDQVREMLNQFQNGLNKLASRAIHTGETNKYTSINNKGDYVEFRSPGGDWLGTYGDESGKVKNTLLRTIVALNAAADPEAYKKEYYKKLYKTLSLGQEDNAIEYFAKYAAGEMPKEELKTFIKQIQLQRKITKEPAGNKLYWWNVAIGPQRVELVARNREEAWKKALDEYPSWMTKSINQAQIKPLRPYEGPSPEQDVDNPDANYEIYDRDLGFPVHQIIANTDQEAEQKFRAWAEQYGYNPRTYSIRRIPGRHYEPSGQIGYGPYRYRVDYQYRQRADQAYMQDFTFVDADDQRAAEQKVRQMLVDNGIRDFINVEAILAQTVANPTANTPVPGSTEDLQRQRGADQLRRMFPNTTDGRWEVYSVASGNTIYRFNAATEAMANVAFSLWNDFVRNPGMPREGFALRSAAQAQAPSTPAQESNFAVTYMVNDGLETTMNTVRVMAPDADAAVDRIRTNLQRYGHHVESIEAEPVPPPAWRDQLRNHVANTPVQGQGSESLPPGSRRWLIMQNGQEIYSFINREDQASANEYALRWLDQNVPNWRDQRPITVEPVR